MALRFSAFLSLLVPSLVDDKELACAVTVPSRGTVPAPSSSSAPRGRGVATLTFGALEAEIGPDLAVDAPVFPRRSAVAAARPHPSTPVEAVGVSEVERAVGQGSEVAARPA